jgi:hypothetical protein
MFTIEQLRLIRDVLAGKTRPIQAKLAFAGVLLPPNKRLELSDGVVRPVTEAERKLAPDSLKGQLSGTDASGNSTVINYDGDVLLECQFPYKVRVQRSGPTEISRPWPEDMRPPSALERAAIRLRFSVMLAVERETRAQLVQTWRYFDEPVQHAPAVSWSDPRRGTGIMPTQLTEAEVTAWGEWYGRLSTAHVDRIELALSRILRAIAERHEPSDVLIDSVIAWENLFGTKEGEPTFRVTTCLAVLLEESLQARKDRRKRLADIYGLRSKVVHGSGNVRGREYPMCYEALDTAIGAIRVLVTDRTDILELPDGAARSNHLLLGVR